MHTVCAAKSANPQENAGRYSLGNAGCQHQIAQYVHPSSASGGKPNATTTESGPAGVENGRSAMPETNNAKATWSCQRIVTRFITLEQGDDFLCYVSASLSGLLEGFSCHPISAVWQQTRADECLSPSARPRQRRRSGAPTSPKPFGLTTEQESRHRAPPGDL